LTDITPSTGSPTGFPFEEKHAGACFGLTKDVLRVFRQEQLADGSDFITHKKRIYWTAAAVQKLQDSLGLPPSKKTAPAPQRSIPLDPAPVKATLTELQVVRADLPNSHMLIACALDDDHLRPTAPFRVRVRDTKNFVRGMLIPVQVVAGYQDLFDLTRPTPRQKGRW
jgi:hypothetical protein